MNVSFTKELVAIMMLLQTLYKLFVSCFISSLLVTRYVALACGFDLCLITKLLVYEASPQTSQLYRSLILSNCTEALY